MLKWVYGLLSKMTSYFERLRNAHIYNIPPICHRDVRLVWHSLRASPLGFACGPMFRPLFGLFTNVVEFLRLRLFWALIRTRQMCWENAPIIGWLALISCLSGSMGFYPKWPATLKGLGTHIYTINTPPISHRDVRLF